jgi:glycine/D-amino acid oxidase-like deaminating enzyme
VDAQERCAALDESGSQLAQIHLDQRVLGQIPRYRKNTIDTVRLAIAAREHLFSIAALEGIDFNHERRGILHFYATQHEFEAALNVNALLREDGLDRRPVSPAEIRAIEPALHGDLYGGFFTESDSIGDIHKFTRGLAEACIRHGVEFRYDTNLEAVSHERSSTILISTEAQGQRSSISFDSLVICAGVGSRAIASLSSPAGWARSATASPARPSWTVSTATSARTASSRQARMSALRMPAQR